MVPAGARQIDGIAGSAGTASRAQAAAGTAYRCGIKHPGNIARFWPECTLHLRSKNVRVREARSAQIGLDEPSLIEDRSVELCIAKFGLVKLCTTQNSTGKIE